MPLRGPDPGHPPPCHPPLCRHASTPRHSSSVGDFLRTSVSQRLYGGGRIARHRRWDLAEHVNAGRGEEFYDMGAQCLVTQGVHVDSTSCGSYTSILAACIVLARLVLRWRCASVVHGGETCERDYRGYRGSGPPSCASGPLHGQFILPLPWLPSCTSFWLPRHELAEELESRKAP